MEERKISIPLIIGGIVLVIVIGAGGVLLTLNKNKPANTGNTTSSNNTTTQTSNIPTGSTTGTMMNGTTGTMMSTYKNGTYSVTSSYFAPSGDEAMGVSITLANDTIQSVTITPESNDFTSQRYQEQFAQVLPSIVTGKKINDAYLSGRVSSSSLTINGFNDALNQIKQQAAK